MAEANIVKSIRKKNSSGTYDSPSFLSAELRFIEPSRKSNNNNIEEELFLGTDCLTTEWTDELGRTRITKEFHDSSEANPTNYYILDTYLYNENAQNADFYFKDGKLFLPGEGSINDIREDDNGNLTYYGEDIDIYMYSEDGDDVLINPSFSTSRVDILRFKQSTGDIIDVSQKTTQIKYSNDGLKKMTKEIIVNYL